MMNMNGDCDGKLWEQFWLVLMNDALMKVLPVDANVNVSQRPDIDYGGDYCEAITPTLFRSCISYNVQYLLRKEQCILHIIAKLSPNITPFYIALVQYIDYGGNYWSRWLWGGFIISHKFTTNALIISNNIISTLITGVITVRRLPLSYHAQII